MVEIKVVFTPKCEFESIDRNHHQKRSLEFADYHSFIHGGNHGTQFQRQINSKRICFFRTRREKENKRNTYQKADGKNQLYTFTVETFLGKLKNLL